ncbi:hypothetical protein [Nocardia tengchongensis]|uniref:hypothetical protein n=1 Tax=Nocardia tengchongensis TaxID=2055889 RepID=UPI003609C7ED
MGTVAHRGLPRDGPNVLARHQFDAQVGSGQNSWHDAGGFGAGVTGSSNWAWSIKTMSAIPILSTAASVMVNHAQLSFGKVMIWVPSAATVNITAAVAGDLDI